MAGVTKGAFYVHFESKDALYVALFSKYVERLDTEYQAFLDSLPPEISSGEMLLALVKAIVDLMITQIGYDRLKTVYQLQLAKTMDMEVIKSYGRKLYAIFGQVLSAASARANLRRSCPWKP